MPNLFRLVAPFLQKFRIHAPEFGLFGRSENGIEVFEFPVLALLGEGDRVLQLELQDELLPP